MSAIHDPLHLLILLAQITPIHFDRPVRHIIVLDIDPLFIGENGDITSLFNEIKNAISQNISKSKIARGFIEAVANYVIGIALKSNINQVVLSGGTFLNRLLTEKVITELEEKHFKVYIAEQLPPGDGGICLGQIFLM